jgi:MraZ protein
MFLGEYTHALDLKGRLTIPARFRGELEAGLVVTRGAEPCLVIYPQEEWVALARRAAQMPTASRTARSYTRRLFGGAHEATLDKMGRILVPSFLRDYAGVTDEAVVVGLNTYIEVWNPERWRQGLEEDSENLEAILADVARMGV